VVTGQLVATPARRYAKSGLHSAKDGAVFSEYERSLYAGARPSVRLSVCLSVTFVHSTVPVEIYGNISTPFDALAIR